MTHQTGTMNNNQCCHSLFGCHVAISDETCVIVSVHEWSFGFVDSHLGSWAANGICGRSVSLYLIVGIGRCVVVVVVDERQEECYML